MEFQELITNRYSTRAFADAPVEREKLGAILASARLAPTAHNSQPQRIKIVSAPEELAKIDDCSPCRYGAPVVFVICYDGAETWRRPFDGVNSGVVDASIVTAHMMLQAEALGLASCWVMFFNPEKLIKAFGLAEGLTPIALLPVGYGAPDAAPSPFHTDRKPLSELLL
ncbi:MAG: nitroreductase family protein [Oscillospiraceae bacterium]|jgi:nitroreductase|nr:nitroreductase family protein [Oscillospiraceae bacterium]